MRDLLRVASPAPFSRREHYSLQAAMSKLKPSRSRGWRSVSHQCNPQRTFLSSASTFRKNTVLFEGSLASAACPSDNNSVKISVWHRWNDNDRGRTALLGRQPVPTPLCSPQISHGLARDRNRVSTVRSHQFRSSRISTSMVTRV
jgi:hypothetical protein